MWKRIEMNEGWLPVSAPVITFFVSLNTQSDGCLLNTFFFIFMKYLWTIQSGNSGNICDQIYPSLFMFLIEDQTILDERIYGIIETAYF